MTDTITQILAGHKAGVQTLTELGNRAHADFEKFVALNLSYSKAVLKNSFSHVHALAGAKDATQVLAVQAGLFKPLAEQSTNYLQDIQALAAGRLTELKKVYENSSTALQTVFSGLAETLGSNPLQTVARKR
jgi:phasin family protein